MFGNQLFGKRSCMDKSIWEQALNLIKFDPGIDKFTYDSVLKPMEVVYSEDNVLVLAAKDEYCLTLAKGEALGKIISTAIRSATNKDIKVTFVKAGDENAVRSSVNSSKKAIRDENLSKTTPTGLNGDFTFANFVVGDCNRFAHASAVSVADKPGQKQKNPFFLWGNSGLGKTHLMKAIGNSIIQNYPKKKVLYTTIFAIWMLATTGVELIQEAEILWEGRAENQTVGYQYRSERSGGNDFAKYASASVFAPLIFTIPFSSMVETPYQENQMMMNGANFIKNIISGLTILALFLLLKRGDWRKHVLPIATMCGYLAVLVFSNFAHSERFHFPVVALELLFAAYGVTQLTNKHKRWFMIWLVVICVANIAWAFIKLKGRGLA